MTKRKKEQRRRKVTAFCWRFSEATVNSSGVVIGLKAGTATITASVDGGTTAVCTEYVAKPNSVYYIRKERLR